MTVGISGTQTYATIDTGAVTPFSGVLISSSDPNAPVTVSFYQFPAPDGTLSNLGGLTLGADLNGDSVYSITGTAASVQATLRGVVFAPTANQVPVGQTVSTQFVLSASDGAVTTSDFGTIIVAAAGLIVPVIGPVLTDTADTANVPNPGGSVVVSFQKYLQTVTVSTPVSGPMQTAASVRIEAVLNGSTVVYDQTFASPYSSPVVQAAVAQADAALAANGASADGPSLASSVTSVQSSTMTVQTGSFLDTFLPNGSMTNFGPGVIGPGVQVGTSVLGYLTLLAGQTDINIGTTTQTTIDQTVTTTPTTLTTQAYVISGSNDAYSISGALTAQATSDAAALAPLASIILANPDTQALGTATVTLSAANGTLSNLGGGTLSGGIYSVTGSTAAIQAALQGLVFTPSAHQVAPGQTVTTGFAVSVSDGVAAAAANASVIATATTLPPGPISRTQNGVTDTLADGSVFSTGPGTDLTVFNAGGGSVTTGGADTVFAGAQATAVQIGGAGATVVGEAGALTVVGGTGQSTVFGGAGGLTYTGGAGYDTVVGGAAPESITGGSGGGVYVGGGGGSLTAGAGGVSVVLGGNGDRLNAAGPGTVLFGITQGNATFSSIGATGETIFFGQAGTGSLSFITGSGLNLLGMGQGQNTVTLGSGTAILFGNTGTSATTNVAAGTGTAEIVFGGASMNVTIGAAANARTLYLFSFAPGPDHLTLSSTSAAQLSAAIAGQTQAGPGTILALPGGTNLFFMNNTHVDASMVTVTS